MTLELIFFITAILFGMILYWTESKGNSLYRFVNKIFNSKEIQMKATDKKGFVYKQPFLLRLVFVSIFFLLFFIVVQFLIPIQMTTVSIFASMIVGTVIGTYLATVIFKSSEIIEEQAENIEDFVQDTFEKGKDFVEDLTDDKEEETIENKTETKEANVPKEKSARERLKDKGLM